MKPTKHDPITSGRPVRLISGSVLDAAKHVAVMVTAKEAARTRIIPAEVGTGLPA